eukprot:697144-Pyramimonas_sp.AAC.1
MANSRTCPNPTLKSCITTVIVKAPSASPTSTNHTGFTVTPHTSHVAYRNATPTTILLHNH